MSDWSNAQSCGVEGQPGAAEARSDRARAEARGGVPTPSRFSLIYESKDGKLCLFEDADGHITAVRAEKLA